MAWPSQLLCAAGLCLVAVSAPAQVSEAACAAEDLRSSCLVQRAEAALPAVNPDERALVVGTLLGAVSVPSVALLAAARRIAHGKDRSDRLQVAVPLAEQAMRRGDKREGRALVARVGRDLDALAKQRSSPAAYLQIGDVCLSLLEMNGGTPPAVAHWAVLWRRYCNPEFFERMTPQNGFGRVMRNHMQLVSRYFVFDREGMKARLLPMLIALRTIESELESNAEYDAADRESGILIGLAMQSILGALGCLMDLPEECRGVLLTMDVPDEVEQSELWSTWAATQAVRAEGLVAIGRFVDGIGMLDWLQQTARDPRYRGYEAVFLSQAAWLALRMEALKRGPVRFERT